MEECDATVQKVIDQIRSELEPVGFEGHPFLIKWYNELVSPDYQLDYNDNNLAFIIISTPCMFEKAFKPFVCRQDCLGVKDPIDECVANYFKRVKENFSNFTIDSIHDFELKGNRKPKVLVQTAGHVAGATFFYQRQHVKDDPWDKKKKICGVAVHPTYGGWFALRGVLIFKDLTAPQLKKKEPLDIVCGDCQRIDLLNKFNFHWRDWSFRDIVPAKEKYSEEQKNYFATLPKDRKELVESWKP